MLDTRTHKAIALENVRTWAKFVAQVMTHSMGDHSDLYYEMTDQRKFDVAMDLRGILAPRSGVSAKDFLLSYYNYRGAGENGLGQSVMMFQGTDTLLDTVADELTVEDVQNSVKEGLAIYGVNTALLEDITKR